MKKCFKCKKNKDINQFYSHKGTTDGHLGKCKFCTKKDMRIRYSSPEGRLVIAEYEKSRFKNPERKANILKYQRERRIKHPGKFMARQKLLRMVKKGVVIKTPCEVCQDPKSQAHHVDYRKALDVRWLCFKHHRQEHGQLVLTNN